MTKTIHAADLFCGAGGTSTGLLKAAEALGFHVNLLAINHWQVAIATHSQNHPDADHRCESLDNVDPRKAVPGGKLDLLVASPECTHHSRARGGKPMSDQSRASAWHVLRWCEALDVKNVLIENVPEFQDWGPLDSHDRPIKRQKGRIYRAFLSALRALGYSIDARVVNAADYGDPTTRKRLFIMARKGRKVKWPEPTHSQHGADLFGDRPRWKPAREIIDWELKGESIFTRKKPLSPNTIKRIEAGLKRYGGKAFLAGHPNTTWDNLHSVESPLQTITASSSDMALIEPYIIPVNHGKGDVRTHSLRDPMPTITSIDAWGFVEPFIIQMDMGGRLQGVDEPLNTVTSADARALVEPFIVMLNGTTPQHLENSNRSVDDPLPTVVSVNHAGLVEPFLVEYNGTSTYASVDSPLSTITGSDRFGLVEPLFFQQDGKTYMMDIRFRMLQPHELARAMSFPTDYKFHGNREQVVKQIGNAVPVETAAALCQSLLA